MRRLEKLFCMDMMCICRARIVHAKTETDGSKLIARLTALDCLVELEIFSLCQPAGLISSISAQRIIPAVSAQNVVRIAGL